jgi:hypothetical protein
MYEEQEGQQAENEIQGDSGYAEYVQPVEDTLDADVQDSVEEYQAEGEQENEQQGNQEKDEDGGRFNRNHRNHLYSTASKVKELEKKIEQLTSGNQQQLQQQDYGQQEKAPEEIIRELIRAGVQEALGETQMHQQIKEAQTKVTSMFEAEIKKDKEFHARLDELHKQGSLPSEEAVVRAAKHVDVARLLNFAGKNDRESLNAIAALPDSDSQFAKMIELHYKYKSGNSGGNTTRASAPLSSGNNSGRRDVTNHMNQDPDEIADRIRS